MLKNNDEFHKIYTNLFSKTIKNTNKNENEKMIEYQY